MALSSQVEKTDFKTIDLQYSSAKLVESGEDKIIIDGNAVENWPYDIQISSYKIEVTEKAKTIKSFQ